MSYAYDIFISYKRSAEAGRWIEDHFQPLLEHSVELELGRRPVIFRDNQLADGGSWPLDLGLALGLSRVIIPLWTKTYFHSEWCVRELSLMLDREQLTGRRTASNPVGMIIPLVIHDCEDLEHPIRHLEYRDIKRCYNPRMGRESRRAEDLADELFASAKYISRAIDNAPDWRPNWPQAAADNFMSALLRRDPPRQTTVPGFSA